MHLKAYNDLRFTKIDFFSVYFLMLAVLYSGVIYIKSNEQILNVQLGVGGLVAKLCLTLLNPWTVACLAPLSMGSSRQEYWRGLTFPSPGDLPDPRIEPGSPALQAYSLPTEL